MKTLFLFLVGVVTVQVTDPKDIPSDGKGPYRLSPTGAEGEDKPPGGRR